MQVLSGLQPEAVFRYFEEISSIPRSSGNRKPISDYCVAFAKQRGLACWQDDACNVIIKKPASPGYEDAAPVVFQGHLDMVAEKLPGSKFNFETDGLHLQVCGDWISADGTTLGGDNGIAVAFGLALLDDPTLCHPSLEVLLTTDEEIGMLGAVGLDASPLEGRILLNMDSEAEGVFTVSCAGGASASCRLPVSELPCGQPSLTITVGGLAGGHSGIEIGEGRGNANVLLGRVLDAVMGEVPLRLVTLDGGGKDNAIASFAQAVVALPSDCREKAAAAVASAAALLKNEYAAADPGLTVSVSEGETAPCAMSAEDTVRCIRFLLLAPNGVQEMSRDIPGLVQTSLNLGILKAGAGEMRTVHSVRSSIGSQKTMLLRRLEELTRMLGGTMDVAGDYPAWEYRKESPLRDLMVQVYREQQGKEPVVEAIHAGLECGILCGKLPGLDCVSYGPDLMEIHTPRERMSISSVQRLWEFTIEVLRRSK